MIIGLSIGGVLLVLLVAIIIAAIIFLKRRKKVLLKNVQQVVCIFDFLSHKVMKIFLLLFLVEKLPTE